MAKPATADLVPITREFLRNFYAGHDVPALEHAFGSSAMMLNMSLLQVVGGGGGGGCCDDA